MSTLDEEESKRRSDVDSEGEGDDLRQEEPFDSSEEEEDDDEEEIQKIREGFIVDDDEDGDRRERKKKKHKRRREAEKEPKEDEGLLDEDDLDLLMENSGAATSKEKSQFKRLKRAAEEEAPESRKGLNDFFSDEEEEGEGSGHEVSVRRTKDSGRTIVDELDDFIEDEFSDLDEDAREEARERRKQERLKPTEITGIDSEKVDELYDIFGDGEDYAWALEAEDQEGEFRDEESKPQLEDIYEPEELKAKMLTDGDKVIRDTDVPERYQELRKHIKNYELSEEDFIYEKEWISYQLGLEKNIKQEQGYTEEEFKKIVYDAVTFIARQNLEVPFIYSYRRDYLLKYVITGEGEDADTEVTNVLNEDDLWRIVQLDIEYHSLLEKRKTVEKLIVQINVDDENLKTAFENSNNITSLQDIHEYVNFTYGSKLRDLGLKRSSKGSIYEKVKANELYEVVRAIGITSEKFSENVIADSILNPTHDSDKTPLEMVEEFCKNENSLYAKPSQALEVTKHFFAEQLFVDLKLRTYLRETYRAYSSININLTEQGRLRIDKNSPYADFKYAINRSVVSLVKEPDLFLRMLEAESQHLVEIRLEIISADQFLARLYSFLLSDGQSDVANEWNKYRRSSLDIALKKLIPLVALNIKEDIRRECERILFFDVRALFLKKIDQAPYKPHNLKVGTVPRVFAISPGNGRFGADSIIGVFLNEHGDVVETYKFDENPLIPVERLQQGETAFSTVFAGVIRVCKPDVIAINGFNVKTHRLFEQLGKIVETEGLTVDSDDQSLLPVVWVNDEVATRYQSSVRAEQEFLDKPALVRYTIALGRYLQSPLLEYISLGDDLQSLSIHKHQHLLSEDKLDQAITSALVDIVNVVGVDINKAVSNSYLAALVPYISGLGPRKAIGLLRAIQQHPLFSRQALITNENVRIGSVIFLNCAGFIRIPQSATKRAAVRTSDEVEAVTLLDDTRIHPEDYALADKMAADALDLEESEIEELKDAPIGETIIDKLIERGTESLQTLILEDYAKQLEATYHKKKSVTLQMILEELQDPYLEMRRSFKPLTSIQIFETLTGESPETIYDGCVLPVNVKKVGGYEVNAITSSQISCTADSEHAIPRHDHRSLSEIYQVSQTVPAKILHIDYSKFTAVISLLKHDVDHPSKLALFTKEYGKWDLEKEKRDEDLEKHQQEAITKATRVIKHPLFHNFNARQAQDYLAPKERGAIVIRPSSKGNNHIAITWKVDNALYQHVDVVEHNKDNEFSLGKRLVIGNNEFSDLDEIIETYIGEIVKRVDEMTHHDKFRNGTRDEVTQWLENYSKANPKRASYAFALNHKSPGWFLLLFKTNSSSPIYTWNVKAIPNGFELNGYDYPDMVTLCNGFKTLIKNKQQQKRKSALPSAPRGYGQSYGESYAYNNRSTYTGAGYTN